VAGAEDRSKFLIDGVYPSCGFWRCEQAESRREEVRDKDGGSEEGTGEEIGWRQKGGYEGECRCRARSRDCSTNRVSEHTELAFHCVGTRDWRDLP
jgi:hypothetical protein